MTHPLRSFRKANGLSLAELAEKVGTTKATLSRIEKRVQDPSLSLIAKIKKATGDAVSADDFLFAAPSDTERATA